MWVSEERWDRQHDSLLNPNNAIVQQPSRQISDEVRGEVRGEFEQADFTLRGIAVAQNAEEGGTTQTRESYLSQAFARLHLGSHAVVSGGRELLAWGPGQLRSPSNPYYFDAGKNQPLREVSGIDVASLLYVGDSVSVQAVHVLGNGYTNPAQGDNFSGNQTGSKDLRGNNLIKLDRQGDNWQSSVVAAKTGANPLYVGAFGQWTVNDAWLLYAEVGSGARPQSLQANTYQTISPSERATTALLGSSYTFENGQTVYTEYLYDGHGYNRDEERAYFDEARQASGELVSNPAAGAQLGLAISAAPVMLNQRYLLLAWQSSPQDNDLFWRATWTANVDDGSSQLGVFVEKNVSSQVTMFGYLTRNIGAPNTEFGALLKGSARIGVKIFLL